MAPNDSTAVQTPKARSYSPKGKKKAKEPIKLCPIQTRPRLSESYDKPVSGRETWWRCTIRETPLPGTYEVDNFIGEMVKRPNTYRFKSDGRKLNPQPQIGTGEYLLPGAYNHKDLTARMNQFRSTYGFKDTSRSARDIMNFGRKDKDIEVSPDAYQVEKYQSLSTDKSTSKFWQFKSQTQRFPTVHFRPKDGPAPGHYEGNRSPSSKHAVTSSFKSKAPRFKSSHTMTPGPGTYESVHQSPKIPSTVANMGRLHGIFFSSAFHV
ncbi:hypothetical protein CAPTEDRAFT_224172 [Capitella teleta]|uniref:Uncharacterized protein n=1 Tax=Capitella teleta TaxID=283909 RepID=R7TB38_CAPTE|nr:hypothetical protein CAPTEDRAFT_224172 [Capitella teleta]|eukprot:ELT88702.1 hypothetical protein CAPTEDRAFT_224172 [Capitella teleta]